jgi:hypothetical protein
MDSVVLEESLNSEVAGNDFVDKQWLYVNDNNNSSYTGQIVVDTTSLSNSGAYLNWSEAFLLFPLILQMDWIDQSVANPSVTSSTNLDWVQGMKCGYWNILHNMSVEFNNSTIVQQSNFLNVFSSFKAHTSWSDADVKNWGSVTGYCPDTSTSWVFNQEANSANNTLGAGGTGLCNNRNGLFLPITSISAVIAGPITVTSSTQETLATLGSTSTTACVNNGFYQRQKWLNFSMKGNTGAAGDLNANQAWLLGGNGTALSNPVAPSAFSAVFMSYVDTTKTNSRAMIFPAIVRLKDVCDFFAKCPLLKGSTMRFYMNTNQVQFMTQQCSTKQVAPTTAGGATSLDNGSLGLVSQPVILGGGQTCPVMVASADLGQGGQPLGGISDAGDHASAILHTLSIVRTQFVSAVTFPVSAGAAGANTTITPKQYNAPIQSVRLYCPAYTFAPLAEARYLSLSPTKKIVYNDIFQYTIPSTALSVGANFSVLVTNGIPNLRSIVAMGFIPSTNNGVTTSTIGDYLSTAVGSLQSPFSSSGGTPDPIIIQNFQIQVSGKNLFINQLYYDFEQFTEQLVSSNQLNGSLTTSLGSGQISLMDFERCYRYYYGNVARHLPSEDGVSKSIQLLGTMSSGVAPTMLVFCEFEKEVVVDVRSGMRIV